MLTPTLYGSLWSFTHTFCNHHWGRSCGGVSIFIYIWINPLADGWIWKSRWWLVENILFQHLRKWSTLTDKYFSTGWFQSPRTVAWIPIPLRVTLPTLIHITWHKGSSAGRSVVPVLLPVVSGGELLRVRRYQDSWFMCHNRKKGHLILLLLLLMKKAFFFLVALDVCTLYFTVTWISVITPPKIKHSSENLPSQRKSCFRPSIFQGLW